MKKRWTLSCVVIIVVIYFIYDYYRPQYIEENFSSIIYSNETQFEKPTVVSLKGDIQKKLIGKDVFKGELIVDEDLKYEVTLRKDNYKYFGILIIEDSFINIKSIGTIMASKDLDKIWIQLNDINERYKMIEGYISGPATNIEDANEIAVKVLGGKH